MGGISAHYLSCKVLNDWSILILREKKSYLFDGCIFAALFETIYHCFFIKSTGVA